MRLMRLIRSSMIWGAAVSCLCGLANGTVIYSGTLLIQSSDPTQLGRLNRNSIPSDWSVPKAFPGTFDATTTFHYTTLDLDLTALEAPFTDDLYVQIDVDSTSRNTFVAAYLNAYDPTQQALNYLGDAGGSGNPFPGDPAFFQIF